MILKWYHNISGYFWFRGHISSFLIRYRYYLPVMPLQYGMAKPKVEGIVCAMNSLLKTVFFFLFSVLMRSVYNWIKLIENSVRNPIFMLIHSFIQIYLPNKETGTGILISQSHDCLQMLNPLGSAASHCTVVPVYHWHIRAFSSSHPRLPSITVNTIVIIWGFLYHLCQ